MDMGGMYGPRNQIMYFDLDNQIVSRNDELSKTERRLIGSRSTAQEDEHCLVFMSGRMRIGHVATGNWVELGGRSQAWSIVHIDVPAGSWDTSFYLWDDSSNGCVAGCISYNIVKRVDDWTVIIT